MTHIEGKNHRSKVVLAINMYTFVKYDARLSLWRVFSARYSGDHVWRWNASWSQPLRQANTVWQNPDWLCDVLMSAHVYHCAKNSGGFPNTCWKSDTITRQMHAVLVLFRPLPNVDIQKFGMWGMYNLTKTYGNIENPFANRRVEDWYRGAVLTIQQPVGDKLVMIQSGGTNKSRMQI